MNTKLISGLASICAVCALIIVCEWFYALWAEKSTLPSLTATDTKTSHDDMPHINLTKQPEQSFADLVTRPLFIKGRKPVDEPTPEDVQNAAAAAVPVVFDWELNGIYTTTKGLSALFSRSKSKVAKDNYRKISIGADLDGWKLAEIYEDKAILKQGAQQKELPLRKIKVKDLSKKPNNPNIPAVPQPEENPVPAEGEIETTNE